MDATRQLVDALEEASEITIPKEELLAVARELRENEKLRFEHLSFITAVDYGECFELVYRFYSYGRKRDATLKVRVEKAEPLVDSLTPLWTAADWQEREVYDLFGIGFAGHPNLKRILLAEDFPGHPLRKEFPHENDEEYLLR